MTLSAAAVPRMPSVSPIEVPRFTSIPVVVVELVPTPNKPLVKSRMTVFEPPLAPTTTSFFSVLLVARLSQDAPFCRMAESAARREMIAVSPAATFTVIRPLATTNVHGAVKGDRFSSACWNGSSEATGVLVDALQPASANIIKQLRGRNDRRLRMKIGPPRAGRSQPCDAYSRSTGSDERDVLDSLE